MSIVKILPVDKWAQWDHFVLLHRLGSIYHTSSWCRVIEQAYGHQPVYVVLEDDAGVIQAGLPLFYLKSKLAGHRLVCLPGAQACDPLVSNQHEYDQLVAFVLDFMERHRIKSVELRTSTHLQLDSRKFGHEVQEYSCYILNLDRELQTIESSLKRDSIRRRIKTASARGLQLVVGKSLNDTKEFYKLYLQLRKSLGLLPQPYIFFSRMFELMLENNNIDVLHVKYDNQIISSVILLKYKDTVHYEFGASRLDMMHMGTSPFLLWEAIKKAKQDGYKRFDFGRTSDDNPSLIKFKLSWGTVCEALPYYFIPSPGKAATIRRKSLAKTMMSHTIHYSPTLLCQLMGRTLYKYLI